ncbi:MAG: hypothetical protein NZM07_11960, partial [Elioraea sp.]|nr:hypothetical protein [Elioraea sp.]
MISAEVVAASRHPGGGPALYTLALVFPTFLLPEVLTHRDRARNTSSTRAIPTRRLLETPPYVPAVFRANRKGMQPGEALDPERQERARRIWEEAAEACRRAAEALAELGVHKQWAGRPLT